MNNTTLQDYESLRSEITSRRDSLSKRLRQIAIFALDHPTDMALETIAVISKRAEVQPSALIRFAKTFGYIGFSEMQKAFQSRVVERSASYKERVRAVDRNTVNDNTAKQNMSYSLLKQYCNSNILSLEALLDGAIPEDLKTASTLLEQADNIFIMAQRRSYPVATYLNYALNQVECRAHLLDDVGGMLIDKAKAMREKDVLIAITFPPYSADTAEIVALAKEKNSSIIVISDNALNSTSNVADVCIEVHDAEVHSFRSLSATMCVAQTLATSLAFKDENKGD